MPYTSCDECGEETYYPTTKEEVVKEVFVPDSNLQKKLYELKEKIYIKMFTIYDQMGKQYEEKNPDTNQLINLTNQINILKYVIGEI
jgi:hypothetical protein